MTNDRTINEAEQATLGACLLSRAAVEQVLGVLRGEQDFEQPRHALIYTEILELHRSGANADPVSVANALRAKGLLIKVQGPYLHTLLQACPSDSMAGYYARIVRDAADLRHVTVTAKMLGAAVKIADPALRAVEVARVRDRLDGALAGEPGDDNDVSISLGAVPSWPTGDVPGPIGDLARASGGLPDALFGGTALVAVATVCPVATIEADPTMIESPILWVAAMAPPGAGKSPAMSIGLGPLEILDAAQHELYRDALQIWRDSKPSDRGEKPANPTRLVRDTTLEQLARRLDGARLAGGTSAATFAPDELQNFLGALGQYKRGSADRARMLELWAGRPWQYERVGGDVDLLIPRPVVPIVGGIQPELHPMLGSEGDGLRPRWLLHLAGLDPVAQEAGGMAHVPDNWAPTLTTLYNKLTTPRSWLLAGKSLQMWRDARRRWKAAAARGESASTSAALVKADVQVVRLALVVAESLEPARGGDVPPEAMSAAIAIVDYVMDCWRALPEGRTLGLSRRSEVLDLAVDKVRDWLESHGGKARRRELLTANVAGVRTMSDVEALLERYLETYPGTVATERTGQRGPATVVVYAPRRRGS